MHSKRINFFPPVQRTAMDAPVTVFLISEGELPNPQTLPINSLALLPIRSDKYLTVVDYSLHTLEINSSTGQPEFIKLPLMDSAAGIKIYDDLKTHYSLPKNMTSPSTIATSPTHEGSYKFPLCKISDSDLRSIYTHIECPEALNPDLFIMKKFASANAEFDFNDLFPR